MAPPPQAVLMQKAWEPALYQADSPGIRSAKWMSFQRQRREGESAWGSLHFLASPGAWGRLGLPQPSQAHTLSG